MVAKAPLIAFLGAVFLGVGLFVLDRAVADIPKEALWPVLGLCGVGAIVCLLFLVFSSDGNGKGAVMQESSGDRSPNVQAGGDVTIKDSFNAVPKESLELPWHQRAGGPTFRLSPGIDNSRGGEGRLICGFRIDDASPAPGGVEARWAGAGTEADWTPPMRDNTPAGASYLKFSMKPVEMAPQPPQDEVSFEVRFNLSDGPHGGRWTWPLRQHAEKGHRILEGHLGSKTGQPQPEDCW